MKNKIYPAIYRAVHNNEYLYADNDNYYSYERETWNKSGNCDDHENDTNITPEYLANTYGKVESKEHAEFIVDLGDINNLSSRTGYTEEYPSWFCFNDDDELFFFDNESDANDNGEKLITIPLPPKQIQTATSEEEFEMQQIMKNNGDNLILGCEDSKCEEWPQVGDEVIVRIDAHQWDVKYGHNVDGMNGVVRSIFKDDDVTVYAVSVDGVCYCFVRGLLQKPKTPEEELREWLQERIGYGIASGFDCEAIAHDLLHHLKITKKPQ